MKRILPITALLFLFACNDSEKKDAKVETKPENGIEAASQFVRAALDGDYAKARTFLLKDSTNKQTMDTYENYYNNSLTPDDKRAYKTASIRFEKDPRQLNDSTTIVYYSNSYRNKPDSLKVIRMNGEWFIDLNFTFQSKDSIPK